MDTLSALRFKLYRRWGCKKHLQFFAGFALLLCVHSAYAIHSKIETIRPGNKTVEYSKSDEFQTWYLILETMPTDEAKVSPPSNTGWTIFAGSLMLDCDDVMVFEYSVETQHPSEHAFTTVVTGDITGHCVGGGSGGGVSQTAFQYNLIADGTFEVRSDKAVMCVDDAATLSAFYTYTTGGLEERPDTATWTSHPATAAIAPTEGSQVAVTASQPGNYKFTGVSKSDPGKTDDVDVIVIKVEIDLAHPQSCDGGQVNVDLLVTPESAKEYLSNVQFTATKPDGGTTFDNPDGQGITISQRSSDITEWRIDNVRWYSTQSDHCNVISDYHIAATYSIDGSQCHIAPVTITADATFGTTGCIYGDAWATKHWSGDIEINTVEMTPGVWEATISQGTFVRDVDAVSITAVLGNSQYYDMVNIEEQTHVGQYEGTSSVLLNDLWDAQKVMNNATAVQPFVADSEEEAEQAARTRFEDSKRLELISSGIQLDQRRCELEIEAKTAAGSSHRVAMPCAYAGECDD